MRSGIIMCAALAILFLAAAPVNAHHEGGGRELCALWHGGFGADSAQPRLRPQYLVASNCGSPARTTIRISTPPRYQPRRAFPGTYGQ